LCSAKRDEKLIARILSKLEGELDARPEKPKNRRDDGGNVHFLASAEKKPAEIAAKSAGHTSATGGRAGKNDGQRPTKASPYATPETAIGAMVVFQFTRKAGIFLSPELPGIARRDIRGNELRLRGSRSDLTGSGHVKRPYALRRMAASYLILQITRTNSSVPTFSRYDAEIAPTPQLI
jgi:hypothetical protein